MALRRVESLSGTRAPAADGPLPLGLVAVPWDSCETYEAGGLGVLETPELGRLEHEHVCGPLAEAWNARQDDEALAQRFAQVRVCVAQHFEVFVARFDLAQPLNELTPDDRRDGESLAVQGGGCGP